MYYLTLRAIFRQFDSKENDWDYVNRRAGEWRKD